MPAIASGYKEEMAGDALGFCGEPKTLNGANTN
jgi:hypothetical protein